MYTVFLWLWYWYWYTVRQYSKHFCIKCCRTYSGWDVQDMFAFTTLIYFYFSISLSILFHFIHFLVFDSFTRRYLDRLNQAEREYRNSCDFSYIFNKVKAWIVNGDAGNHIVCQCDKNEYSYMSFTSSLAKHYFSSLLNLLWAMDKIKKK